MRQSIGSRGSSNDSGTRRLQTSNEAIKNIQVRHSESKMSECIHIRERRNLQADGQQKRLYKGTVVYDSRNSFLKNDPRHKIYSKSRKNFESLPVSNEAVTNYSASNLVRPLTGAPVTNPEARSGSIELRTAHPYLSTTQAHSKARKLSSSSTSKKAR